jgi:hypothetical protein
MKIKIFTMISILVTSVLINACSHRVYRVTKQSTVPRAYFVDDQLSIIRTNNDIPLDKPVFIELGTRDGHLDSGNLIRITETDITYVYAYSIEGAPEGRRKILKVKTVPKDDVLFISLW